MLHAIIFKTRTKCRGVSHLESPNTSRKHCFTNAEGRHVHSFTLNGKVKERESPETGAFYFQSDRDSVSFHDQRENSPLSQAQRDKIKGVAAGTSISVSEYVYQKDDCDPFRVISQCDGKEGKWDGGGKESNRAAGFCSYRYRGMHQSLFPWG